MVRAFPQQVQETLNLDFNIIAADCIVCITMVSFIIREYELSAHPSGDHPADLVTLDSKLKVNTKVERISAKN